MAINLNIPTNAYSSSSSYSGLGQNWQPWSAQNAQPVITNLLKSWPQQMNSQFGQGLRGVTENAINPALQNSINSLQSRGILNSSVAGDTLRGTNMDIISKLLEQQGAFAGQSAMALPGFALNAAQLGASQSSQSSDPGEPYRAMLQAITSMMG